jgi:hypothetical protein
MWDCCKNYLHEVEISEEKIGLDAVNKVGHGHDFLNIADGFSDSLAPVARIAIPQFLCFIGACGGAAGYVGLPPEFISHANVCTNGGRSPVINDFTRPYGADYKFIHEVSFP